MLWTLTLGSQRSTAGTSKLEQKEFRRGADAAEGQRGPELQQHKGQRAKATESSGVKGPEGQGHREQLREEAGCGKPAGGPKRARGPQEAMMQQTGGSRGAASSQAGEGCQHLMTWNGWCATQKAGHLVPQEEMSWWVRRSTATSPEELVGQV